MDEQTFTLPFDWAVPSWVTAGTVAENCRFLAGKVPEVALCFFETSGTLAYGPDDLPGPEEAGLLRFHVHLPMDLDWGGTDNDAALEAGARACARTALAVLNVASSLRPRLAVLHPPAGQADLVCLRLACFLEEWTKASSVPVLLENTHEAPLDDLLAHCPGLFGEGAFSVCLDLGHLLRYHPRIAENAGLTRLARLAHWDVLDHRGRHLPLTRLAPEETTIARRLARALPGDCAHVLEIFDWQGIVQSIPVLLELARGYVPLTGREADETQGKGNSGS